MKRVAGARNGVCAGAALLCLGLMPGLARAQAEQAELLDIAVGERPTTLDRFPAQAVAFPDGVEARRDIPFAVIPGYRPLTLDLYAPGRGTQTASPLLVFVHGGAWMGGDSRRAGAVEDFPRLLAGVAARGFVVASVNYRLSGEARFPEPLNDVRIAIRWLRSQNAVYGIDPNRVILWGVSAGGQIVSLAALACDDAELGASLDNALRAAGAAELFSQSDCVSGAVLWYAPTDFSTLDDDRGVASDERSPEAAYLGCAPARCSRERLLQASATNFADAQDPPLFIVHGARDEVVPFAQATRLQALLRNAGADSDLVEIAGVGHSFIGESPRETREATLSAVERTLSFIEEAARAP